mmetsp:Transcript_595/g.1487  ORF Transcript_595/g.1487 Transcript_595/m.1487 type:complete len:349 (-) Transcript_595:48-1094(-)
MGYYNMPPAKLAEELNNLEKLLRRLPVDGAIAALDLLETLARNIIQHPAEEKYRRLRTTNEKLRPLFSLPGASEIVMEMGFQVEGDFMILPKNVQLDFPKHIVKILEAKSYYGKQLQSAKKVAKLAGDPAKAEMLRQLEIDRQERAASAAVRGGAAPAPEAPPPAAAVVKPDPRDEEEEQLRIALELSMKDTALAATPAAEPVAQPVATAPVEPAEPAAAYPASVTPDAPAAKPPRAPKSAFDFERREHPEEKPSGECSLSELRALQKQKFKEFQADPDAYKTEAYQRPASSAPGVKEEQGWWDWMFGGSSSSGSGGGGGGGGPAPDRPKPQMKTIRDLPAAPRRGGG